jgi:hypothetical protein
MQVQLNIRIDGQAEIAGRHIAATLRSLATDFDEEGMISEGDDFGLKDASGNDCVWCVVESDLEQE